MKKGNLNTQLAGSKRNGSIINKLGRLGDSHNPIFNTKNIPPIEVRWIRLNKGDEKTIPHKHEEIQTLITLIRGRHDITINKKTKVILQKEGDYVFIEPGDLHCWKTKKNTLLLVVRWKVKK